MSNKKEETTQEVKNTLPVEILTDFVHVKVDASERVNTVRQMVESSGSKSPVVIYPVLETENHPLGSVLLQQMPDGLIIANIVCDVPKHKNPLEAQAYAEYGISVLFKTLKQNKIAVDLVYTEDDPKALYSFTGAVIKTMRNLNVIDGVHIVIGHEDKDEAVGITGYDADDDDKKKKKKDKKKDKKKKKKYL